MLEAAKTVWYPDQHRDSVKTAQNGKDCRAKGKNFKNISEKNRFTSLMKKSNWILTDHYLTKVTSTS